MRFLFDDKAADFETLRAIGYTATGGADIGEVLVATSSLTDSSPDAWWAAWSGVADRLISQAREAEASDRWETAAGSWLRASNYARTAEFFLHIDPSDARIVATSKKAVDAFRAFALLHPGHDDLPLAVPAPGRRPVLAGMAISEVAIPYEGTTLPGWWLTPAAASALTDASTPAPERARHSLIAIGGFDSTAEEMFHTVAKVAVEHGWNCLIFDGPGQGRAIREQQLFYRADYEVPVSAAVDAIAGLPSVDADKIALLGMSQGGYFAGRAAAFEHRLAAVITWDGVYDTGAASRTVFPAAVMDLIGAGRDAEADALIRRSMAENPTGAWAIANGMWTYGVDSPAEFLRLLDTYTLAGGIAEQIQCPTLVFDAEADHFMPGQPAILVEHLRAPYTLISMSDADGAGEHCNAGSVNRFQTALFDWLG